jgi:hypothetical protein
MRLILKLLALIVLGPLVLGLMLLLGVAATIAAPILWEELTARFGAPPDARA